MKPRDVATIVLAALGVATAVFLSRTSIEIYDWNGRGAERIALFTPSARWWAVAAEIAFGGWLVAMRRSGAPLAARLRAVRPLLALWLLAIPYLPGIPDRFPLLLVLAGPIGRVLIAAIVAACAVRTLRAAGQSRTWTLPSRRWAAIVAFAFYALVGLRSYEVAGVTGDEPHYLIIAQSLMRDGDLKIENSPSGRRRPSGRAARF